MYSDEEKAIILATQAQKLGITSIITFFLLLYPVSLICCIDGYYKAKKAKTLACGNAIVESAYRIVNIARWLLISFVVVACFIVGVSMYLTS